MIGLSVCGYFQQDVFALALGVDGRNRGFVARVALQSAQQKDRLAQCLLQDLTRRVVIVQIQRKVLG